MKTIIDKEAVGARIKQIRMNKGYTLEAFGKLFGAKKGNVQQWEKGRSLPNKERLTTISKIADMTVNELIYGSIDEFIENNLDLLINNYKYPFTHTFKIFNLLYQTKLSIKASQELYNSEITINEVETIIKCFYSALDIIVHYDIYIYIQDNLYLLKKYFSNTREYLFNNINRIMELREFAINNAKIDDFELKKFPEVNLKLTQDKEIVKFSEEIYINFIDIAENSNIEKIIYFPLFFEVIEKLRLGNNAILYKKLSSIVDDSLSKIMQTTGEDKEIEKHNLIKKLISIVEKNSDLSSIPIYLGRLEK